MKPIPATQQANTDDNIDATFDKVYDRERITFLDDKFAKQPLIPALN